MSETQVGGQGPGRCAAVVVAGGRSTRFADPHGRRKPLVPLGERTLLEHALRAFLASPCIEELILVVHAQDRDAVEALLRGREGHRKLSAVLPGGEERTDSVRIGVEAVSESIDLVAIHDGARPFLRRDQLEQVLEQAALHGAALLAVPVTDTLKHSACGELADHTVDRSALWAAQTPQAFRRAEFVRLLEQARRDEFRPTDDAALWERYRGPVKLVEGDASGGKITGPRDLDWARAWLSLQDPKGAG